MEDPVDEVLAERKSEMAEKLLESLMKTIGDLDGLVQGLLTTLPPAKPWQRQLRKQLSEIDRHIEVLRLTISLERDHSEILQAALVAHRALQLANGTLAGGRADGNTRAALQVSERLASMICAFLTP